jgi:hypothetical protein
MRISDIKCLVDNFRSSLGLVFQNMWHQKYIFYATSHKQSLKEHNIINLLIMHTLSENIIVTINV